MTLFLSLLHCHLQAPPDANKRWVESCEKVCHNVSRVTLLAGFLRFGFVLHITLMQCKTPSCQRITMSFFANLGTPLPSSCVLFRCLLAARCYNDTNGHLISIFNILTIRKLHHRNATDTVAPTVSSARPVVYCFRQANTSQ